MFRSYLRRQGLSRASLFLTGFVLLACSPPPQHQQKSDGLESMAVREGLVFDLKLDTLAYMSCQPNSSADASAFFNFHVGAYRTGGIALKSDFVNRMTEINRTGGDLVEIVHISPVLRDARPVLSIRRARHLTTVLAGSPTPFFTSFDDSRLLTRTIPSPGQYLRALPTEDEGPVRFEASLFFPTQNQDSLRTQFHDNDHYSLTVTLGSEAEEDFGYARARPEEDESKKVFGTRFDLKFKSSDNEDFKTDRILESAREYDLETGQQRRDRNWSCPESLQFTIFKQHGIDCPVSVDPSSYHSLQAAVRQVLKAEDWSINWGRRCVVPKRGASSCFHKDEKFLHNVSFCHLEQ